MKDINKEWCLGYIRFLNTTTSHKGLIDKFFDK